MEKYYLKDLLIEILSRKSEGEGAAENDNKEEYKLKGLLLEFLTRDSKIDN